MIKHVITLLELNEQEKAKVDEALEKYGEVYKNALDAYKLMESFIVKYLGSFDDGLDLFMRFYYSARNSYLMGLFSTVRLHHAQASSNLRGFIEQGADAGYSIANPNYKDFVRDDEAEILVSSKSLKTKRMDWLNKNYPARSEDLKRIKQGPQHSMHSNFVDTHRVIRHDSKDPKSPKILTSYFDFEDDYLVRTGIWQFTNTGLAVLGLLYEVNKDHKKFDIIEDFEEIHSGLMDTNLKIREEVMATERFKRANKKTKEKEIVTDQD